MRTKLICLTSFVLVWGLASGASAQLGKGNILFEYWYGGGINNSMSNLLNNARWPNSPDASEWRTSFEGKTDWNNNYGTRARGYLYPPADGDYTFWIASDDDSQLWLSTDDTSAKAVQIASVSGWTNSREWTKYTSQKSAVIKLQAGKKYYIEARQTDGTGGDNLAVGWGGPVIGAGPVVIEGKYLSPFIRDSDLKASNPNPANGAPAVIFPMLSWTESMVAEWHDVYLGTTPNLGPANKVETHVSKVMAFHYHGQGFIPGQTYYWRVDDIELSGTIHTGDLWSFTAAPLIAYSPNPANGAKFEDINVDLTWNPGSSAASHDVYFGTNQADVTAGTGGTLKNVDAYYGTTYEPGTLTAGVTYYWRIDEVQNDSTKLTGEVWSFRIMPVITVSDPNLVGWWKLDEGMGTRVIDWSGHGFHATVTGSPTWVDGYDGGALQLNGSDYVATPSINLNSNTVTMTAWVKRNGDQTGWAGIAFYRAPASGMGFSGTGGATNQLQYHWNDADTTYNFVSGLTVPDNEWAFVAVVIEPSKGTLYLNGSSVVNSVANAAVALGVMNIGQDPLGGRFVRGAIDDVRIYNKALTADQLKQVMRGDPTLAWDPSPTNASTIDIEHATPITWRAGDKASKHNIYLGTDQAAVAAATPATTGIYRVQQSGTSYTSPEALNWGQRYYWRIDEYNNDATISEGRLWSFTITDYLIVDNFEDYNDFSNVIYLTWIDGYGSPAQGIPGNGSGSTVGHLDPPYAEPTITHSGSKQSMPMTYDNTKLPYYSEAVRTWATGQDWTRLGVKAITLWFRGIPASVGSIKYDQAADTYTMTGSGADIWGTSDQFNYAYKSLNGNGSIIARIDTVTNTAAWAKAGLMIRETLDPNSTVVGGYITPDGRVAFQYRTAQGTDMGNPDSSTHTATGTVTLPHWIKLTRTGNTFTVQHSADGVTWVDIVPETAGDPLTANIPMNTNVYIGLAVTAHNAAATCTAKISQVITNGTVTPTGAFTISEDIGITSNEAEPLYVAIEGSNGIKSTIIFNPDPNAVLNNTWQEWNIPLSQFTGVTLNSIKKMYIGAGNKASPKKGGTGSLYFDDIRLYRPRCLPDLTKPQADFNSDCVVDYNDLEILGNNWLIKSYSVTPKDPGTNNMVAYYRFENNVQDSSGNGNNGDPCGVPTYATGKTGMAINLDGINQSVNTHKTATQLGLGGSAAKTVCAWVYTRRFNSGGIFDMGDNVNGQNYSLRTMTDPNVWRAQRYGYPTYDFDFTYPSLNKWVHMALVYDGVDQSWAYADGILVGKQTAVLNTADTRTFAIGLWSGNYFNGLIDELRVYKRALTQEEVAYLAGKTSTFTQPVYWLLTPQEAMDLNGDGVINLIDYATLTNAWLEEKLWP